MNNRAVGTTKEQAAAAFLRQKGMRIVETNFRCKQGEVDIIGWHNGYLTFVEVKYRKSEKMGFPEEAVHEGKQRRIRKCAEVYLYIKGFDKSPPIRFDVIAMCGEQIRWYRNAF